jgi:hypothetical protein
VKIYRGNAAAARAYVEADHGRVDDYYERAPGPTSFTAFEPRVRALLEEVPDMPGDGAG